MIKIRNLEKRYSSSAGPVVAVKGIDLDVAEGEFVVLLGPSGCGKTTTLRCVAGLERLDRGSIEIAGQVVDSAAPRQYVPTERRDIGMVFQSYAVWPHLSVYDNVSLPLREGQHRIPQNQVRDRALDALRLVRLEALETRPVTDLSGGEQQRVALARAIVTHPKVLLMDEPLSNLDARLRDHMRVELKKITKAVGLTSLYVTHDQAEALSLGDRVCVMNDGLILQVGSPRIVYSEPADLFVAQFVGEMNFIKGRVAAANQIETVLGNMSCAVPPAIPSGSEVILAIRPEHVSVKVICPQECNAAAGKIVTKNYLGDATLVEFVACGITLRVKLPGDADFALGQESTVILPPDRLRVYS